MRQAWVRSVGRWPEPAHRQRRLFVAMPFGHDLDVMELHLRTLHEAVDAVDADGATALGATVKEVIEGCAQAQPAMRKGAKRRRNREAQGLSPKKPNQSPGNAK